MNPLKLSTLLTACVALTFVGCAGKNSKGVRTRDSGQSSLMGQTFAGQNACSPENHLRPFVIEWDATDSSMFESLAADDIIIVKYEGCSLKILDECRNESIRGSQGSYKPPEWTAGALEKIDISNEGELYAKLPLGAATLGTRVQGGESFQMEYYVAGTRMATRASVYTDELAANPACADATHFVHAYNLGAFALGSAQNLDTEVTASAYGFGGGGSTSSKRTAEKRGGDLAVCKSDSASEVNGCKAPIRLALREIREGANPTAGDTSAPETDASLNAAGVIDTKLKMSDAARARLDSAKLKQESGDGKGCLSELDAHDALDPNQLSTDPKTKLALPRGVCLMMAGKCDAGKKLARKALMVKFGEQSGAEQVEGMLNGFVGQYCQGKSMGDKDTLLAALTTLQNGALIKKIPAKDCANAHKTVQKLRGKVDLESAPQFRNLDTQLETNVASCFARAGDCASGLKAYKKYARGNRPQLYEAMSEKEIAASLQSTYSEVVKALSGAVCPAK